ncbi:hypothetical protein A2U01_0050973 [Trifolium medium]|uniref:Uncharacterized protein n=1 Tax=Trifolium medium TaxID=97028 RepID=A0A392R0Z4_9FABA|nr:hypothetical protein [Trifolium medium]
MCVLRQSSPLELAYRVEFSPTQIIISKAILDLSLGHLLFMGCVEIPKVKVVRVKLEQSSPLEVAIGLKVQIMNICRFLG